jgi:hypothetical protein
MAPGALKRVVLGLFGATANWVFNPGEFVIVIVPLVTSPRKGFQFVLTILNPNST